MDQAPGGRPIPDPGFAGDDGSVSPQVQSALASYGRGGGQGEYLAALQQLQDARVLVPVVAVLDEVEYDEAGRAHDKTSDMAAVLLTGRDGRQALLAFTDTGALSAWDPQSRPVPVTLRRAAQAALQQGADALVVDVAGPVVFALEGELLNTVASGSVLVRLSEGWGWASPK
jgi:hypothetical protein